MKYLVLGSSGQIGSPLCDYLESKHETVIRFDIEDCESEDLRISNTRLAEALKIADFVYFLAFDVGGSRYLEKYQDSYNFIENNTEIMANTFAALKKSKTPFVFASSQMADMKHSTYGGLKFVGERYTESLGGVTARFWNIYGPEKDLSKSHVITDFILKAKAENKISILTDGTETRQFLHAEDCSRALHLISKKYEVFSGKSIDITSFKWTKIIDVAKIVASKFGGIPVIQGSKIDKVHDNVYVPPKEWILDFWEPTISLEDGIDNLIKIIEKLPLKEARP